MFAVYAAVSLVPVLMLGIVLAVSLRGEAKRRGLAEGRSEAGLIAHSAIDPLLDDRPLGRLTPRETSELRRITATVIRRGDVLRLRVRNLSGDVVFSPDGSGFGNKDDDDKALEAAHGELVSTLTHLNSDDDDSGDSGPASVEMYLPLHAADGQRTVGVLELYLPYAPISRDIASGLHEIYLDLGVGLAVLYLVLFAITASVSRGLRREAALNAYLAEHDVLTELPNRTFFHRRATDAVAAAVRNSESVALAIVDLDRFKEVNDTLGHHNGDGLLKELAARLSASMRAGDTVARLGGDEFGLIVRDVEDAEPALRRLREVIDREVEINGLPLSVQASMGFVIAPEDGTDVDTLLQRADVAMYVAKAQHAGVARYDETLDEYDADSLTLVSELRRGIDEGQLVLHYQPQATLTDGRVRSIEALVRWQHPTHGLLYPDKFLPLAEPTDVIDKLTRWVLRAALADVRELATGSWDMCVAVNVSARSIGRASFASDVLQALGDLDVAPDRLIIEVTETALLSDPQRAADVLARLAAAGVRISLDDFGTGQTSLGYLSALPIHELKIDRTFVGDMLHNQAHAAIVRSIIDLGHNLELRVVGEGVETDLVLASLHDSGCDVAQGFLLARPMPRDEIERWLRAAPRAARAA
ncbi:MAG TPA: EAL domain-containing protein [Solirubrobacteraceae bacterium]|nr:EAL domain-containing protein [Solirubrobacteraceae bacterium]